ncbi:UDP-glucuronosyltransferase 2B1-like [Sitophilus oryzae]|uniref:UDP-glucuronosyltransferase 2B1-like n=1 Tax=Sitophilus oryzae TaxID=7048 RepID=A0A6J2XQV3_SITOR|nr:UDP-glucuronosyltransferase 2B1-like [Sitophilus oryzae]
MGSNLRSSSLPNETIQEIVYLIGTLKQNVIWKFEGDLTDVPPNLMISKWIPQSDILAHPNVIMFISHCGMGGTTEAVYYGVPVVGIAIYADQFLNLKKLSSFGMAVEIPFQQFSGKSLGTAIDIILQDPKYNKNAKIRSRIMKDRVMEPLDEAVYWVEYVIRHNGASHLKSSVGSLTWYQLYLLDVILVIFAIPYILFLLIRYTIRISSLKHKN